MRRGRKLLKAVLPALALPLALAACGGAAPPAPVGGAPCPRIAILAEGADLTRYRAGAARDLTAMVVDARVGGFEARCDFASRDRGVLDVRVTPRFEAERGPAGELRSVDLPWFVALSTADDTEVLARVAGTSRVTFPPNGPRGQAVGQPVLLSMPLTDGRRAADYVVRISFQLTPEELALNRARGAR
jgi:hypothetical protein